MKLIILVALSLVAVAVAAPADVVPPKILRSEYEQNPDGAYSFVYETEDGIKRQETGEVVEGVDADNKPQKFVRVRGSYSYNDKDGNVENISYFADENGFHAEGPSIPKPARR